MLSYQHGFHAGNRADVLKHAVLDEMLRHIAESGTPTLHVETHSGRGVYDLFGAQATKTGEAKNGVLDLLQRKDLPDPLKPWLSHVRANGASAYPGSPKLAADRLGKAGRLVLFEKHPSEHAALTETFSGDRRVQVKKADGYAGALKLAPRRNETMIVFSDPSYETVGDMEELAEWTPRALARWPNAYVLVWLPLFKDEREAEFGAFLSSLEDGIVAGARWPTAEAKDTALAGSALIAYRVPKPVRKAATAIGSALDALWN